MRLRDWALDDRCYAVRLGASLMGVKLPAVTEDSALESGPALELVDDVLHGPLEILKRLVTLPDVQQEWNSGTDEMTWAANALDSFSIMRRTVMLASLPVENPAQLAMPLMGEIEDQLAENRLDGRCWVSGDHPGVADIMLFPVVALSQDLEVPLDLYPAVRNFMRHFKALPGFITMPGVPECH
ncbi:glutathione S-transferase C-terminal domain-containing protein [Gluconobacter cerinus]|uniref:glutathione S-transferase C-terminal domain-containing protein n=1 Tax=Gluconobacter cerinus TaxID=38307 RepID=UPI003AB3FB6F